MYTRRDAPMFKLLRTFASVYATRSFTKSAQELFFSQPTVSKHIKWLEEMVGDDLFIRQGASELIPTKSGELIHQATEKIFGEWLKVLEEVHSEANSLPYYVIGASHSFATRYLPSLIVHLLEINDNKINFDIQVLNSSQVIDALQHKEIDIGFIEKPIRTDNINYHQLLEDELVLAGNLDSDLWLIREDDSGLRHYTEEYMQTRNIHERVMKINNNNSILSLLHKGIGKSIISISITQGLDYIPISGHLTRYFYMVERGYDFHGQNLIDQILDFFEELKENPLPDQLNLFTLNQDENE